MSPEQKAYEQAARDRDRVMKRNNESLARAQKRMSDAWEAWRRASEGPRANVERN